MTEQERLQKNKEIVLAFYDAAINQKDFDAARPYMTDNYIQHNPTAASGPEGLRDWLVEFKIRVPKLKAQIKKSSQKGIMWCCMYTVAMVKGMIRRWSIYSVWKVIRLPSIGM